MEADAAQDNLMQVQRDGDGLTITVHTPPSEPDTVSMLVYFAGIAMTLAGGAVIFGSNNWVGVLPFLGGIVLVAIMFGHRTIKKQGATNCYNLQIQNGTAIFIHNRRVCGEFELAKIGRLWITRHTTNGMPVAHDITIYYDGIERYLFSITDVVETLGSGDELLELLVDYLNLAPVEQKEPETTETMQPDLPTRDAEPIRSGYRSDYATNTPEAARDNRELAPLQTRIGYSLGMALLLLLLCFLPYHPSIAWLLPFYDDTFWNAIIILVTIWIIAPILFSIVLEFSGACTCRLGRNGWRTWPFAGLLAAWLLQSASDLVMKWFDFQLHDSLIVIAMAALMSWIFFRIISGCSCGSHPERG